jgi:hypothetical protein
MATDTAEWDSYEQVAVYLLDQIVDVLGLERVEGRQKLVGDRSGTQWEVEGRV